MAIDVKRLNVAPEKMGLEYEWVPFPARLRGMLQALDRFISSDADKMLIDLGMGEVVMPPAKAPAPAIMIKIGQEPFVFSVTETLDLVLKIEVALFMTVTRYGTAVVTEDDRLTVLRTLLDGLQEMLLEQAQPNPDQSKLN